MKKRRQNQQQQIQKQSTPHKKQKKQQKQPSLLPQQQDNNKSLIFCKCYQSQQINVILSALFSFQNYLQYISIIIRHQQKSISSIQNHVKSLEEFRELRERVSICIQKAKVNYQFINTIINHYSKNVNFSIKYSDQKNTQIVPNFIIHIFIQIAKQWSNLSTEVKRPMIMAIQLVKQYSKFYKNLNGKNNDIVEGPKIFVQGSGMGRIICELQSNLIPQPVSIEACEERVLYYLCGQYFLQKYISQRLKSHHKIYPFIHDFTNRYKTQDSYQSIAIPQTTNLFGRQFSTIQCKADISVNLMRFQQQYSQNKYNKQFDILLSYLCTDRIINILKWIQIVYKVLKQDGIWILIYYSSFEKHQIYISSKQFIKILQKTQFKIKYHSEQNQVIIIDKSMIQQNIIIHYLVLIK